MIWIEKSRRVVQKFNILVVGQLSLCTCDEVAKLTRIVTIDIIIDIKQCRDTVFYAADNDSEDDVW